MTVVTLIDKNINDIGIGAYGTVVLQKGVDGKVYAVKRSLYNNNQSMNELMREREIHIQFYNSLPPNMKKYFPRPVRAKYQGENGPNPSIYAMEAVQNSSTLEYLMMTNKLNAAMKQKIIRDIRSAIMSIWKAGYIHGDMHLANILVNPKTGQVTIIDFGFMRKTITSPPRTNWKVGNAAANQKWTSWFSREWKQMLNNMEFDIGNPNMMVFPQYMKNMDFFAEHHVKYFKNLAKHNRPIRKTKTSHLDMLKQYIRNKNGVKRVTKKRIVNTWRAMNQTQRQQYGSFRPEGASPTPRPKFSTAPRVVTPAKQKGETVLTKMFKKETKSTRADRVSKLLFWMTKFSSEDKKGFLQYISDPDEFSKKYPLCKN